MCYRCNVCSAIVPRGNPLLRHIEYRKATRHNGMEIDKEIPVCSVCMGFLRLAPLTLVLKSRLGKGIVTKERKPTNANLSFVSAKQQAKELAAIASKSKIIYNNTLDSPPLIEAVKIKGMRKKG